MNLTIDNLAGTISGALALASARSPRSQQERIGASEIGWCRQATALKVRGIEPSDSRSMWQATIGTALHDAVFDALRPVFPDWIIESVEVTATLPCGAEIQGHPDIIIPSLNGVWDVKTKDGLESVKRYGVSQSHKYQRHLYALGAVQSGILDDTKPVYVGNIFLDRSGKTSEPIVITEEFDPTLTTEIDSWVSDVIYAVQHSEDGHRDITAPICESLPCEFYTVCRGSLPVGENEIIDTPEVRAAVEQYVTAREEAKTAEALKREAQAVLSGLNGIAGGYQIRTTQIAESEVPGFTRAASVRLDVRKVRS